MEKELSRLVIGVREWAVGIALRPELTAKEVLDTAESYANYVLKGIADESIEENS